MVAVSYADRWGRGVGSSLSVTPMETNAPFISLMIGAFGADATRAR